MMICGVVDTLQKCVRDIQLRYIRILSDRLSHKSLPTVGWPACGRLACLPRLELCTGGQARCKWRRFGVYLHIIYNNR